MITGLLGAIVHILVLVLVYFLVLWGASVLHIAIPPMVLTVFQVILVVLAIMTILSVVGA